jgi:ADP-ribose pyrophosphatase
MGQQAVALNTDYFFCGTLRHLPLLAIVLGRAVQGEAAVLPGVALYWAKEGSFPVIVAEPGAEAAGLLLRSLSEVDVARLDFFEGGFGFQARPRQVRLADGQMLQAMVFGPTADESEPGSAARWRLADWQARYAAEFEATARDYLAQFGVKPPRAVAARFAQMMVRGASRVRATETAPTQLRHHAQATDVDLAALREPYARFFAMEEFDLSFRRFDGSMSPKVTRAVFVACDAVTVLPYDPARDRVLVIDQFRTGPYARGDGQPWQIEVIAGRIDAGEAPEVAARREAEEEAGLHLDRLLPVARYYPSPGCSSEFIYSFVALTDLPDDAAGVFGIAGEAEDIRGHLLSFDQLMALVVSGEVSNAPTLLTTYWLAQHRQGLRGT